MDMVFDRFGQYEMPSLILCNPGTRIVNNEPTLALGEISMISDVEVVRNYNDLSELNFRVQYVNQSSNHMALPSHANYLVNIYNEVLKYRYIYAVGIGFFRIDNTTETTQNGRRFKDVHALSCDIELKNYLLPYIQDGTYPLVGINSHTEAPGILGVAVSKVYGWSIGHVDSSLESVNRSFKDIDVSKNVYDFLLNDLQDAFDCVFLFNIIERKINVVAKRNLGYDTDIHLTGDDLVELIKITDQDDGPYTAFRVFGENAMSISAVNPLGGNVVYNFTNYIPWMDDRLGEKVLNWQNAILSSESDYYDASVQYFEYSKLADNSIAEINRLNNQKSIYQLCRSNILATQSTAPVIQTNSELSGIGGDEIDLSDDVSSTVENIDAKILETESLIASEVTNCNAINDSVKYYNEIRTAIHDGVAIDNYFDSSEIKVLSCYIFEQTYTDNYITLDSTLDVSSQIDDMNLIYHRAKNTLNSISEPMKEFTIDTEDFLFVEKFLPWIKQIEPACTIHIEISDLNVIKLFLSSLTINYEDRSTRLTFSNKLTSFDKRTLFDNLFDDFVRKTITNVKHDDNSYDNVGTDKYITTLNGRRLATSDGKRLTTFSMEG